MKRILCFAIAFFGATVTFAQTGLEIVNRMNQRLSDRNPEGVCVSADVKIPVMGTVTTRTYSRGNKRRMEVESEKINTITFIDDTLQWTYVKGSTEVVLTNLHIGKSNGADSPGMNTGMFDDIPDVYDITIKSQNSVKWELQCRRKKGNKDDDYPKHLTLEVRKDTYEPISLNTKIMGISMTMHHFIFGIPESKVTFNPDDFPGVTVVDQRK